MSENAEQVEIEWASPIRGRRRGDREVFVRTADLENLIRHGHVRVKRTIPSTAPVPVAVPGEAPELDEAAEGAPAERPRRSRKPEPEATDGGES